MRLSYIALLVCALLPWQALSGKGLEPSVAPSRHTNNWAVLVDTSRYWFNYRHIANVLSFYRTVKRLGIPDSQIILMLADDVACNPRNPFPGCVYNSNSRSINIYGENVEVDYRGYEVTVEAFLRLLTGRQDSHIPRSKRLLTDESSNILVYLTGHGGDEFIKFQDNEEVTSLDIANAFETMHQKKRYNEILFMVDTCQATTLYQRFYSPNIIGVGSSQKGQNSYSHQADTQIGLTVIDRFTYYTLEFMERVDERSNATLNQLFASLKPNLLHSTPGWRSDLMERRLEDIKITDFFGEIRLVSLPPNEGYPLIPSRGGSSSYAAPTQPAHGEAFDPLPEVLKRGGGMSPLFVSSSLGLCALVCVSYWLG